MALSILRNPPRGSVLAARVEAFNSARPEAGSRLTDNPAFNEMAELYEVIREPRLWKLPREWVARHVVPVHLQAVSGPTAADAARENAELAIAYARTLQELDEATASAAKRAKEPASDLQAIVLPIIFAEFLSVQVQMPGASANRHYEVTGINLGRSREPLDRNAIRRAVQKFLRMLARLPNRQVDAVLLSISVLCDEFASGQSAA